MKKLADEADQLKAVGRELPREDDVVLPVRREDEKKREPWQSLAGEE